MSVQFITVGEIELRMIWEISARFVKKTLELAYLSVPIAHFTGEWA